MGELIKENFRVFTSGDMEMYEHDTGIPFDFLLSFNASGLKSTLFWWLENDMPYSAAEMARIYEKISFYTNFQIIRAAKENRRKLQQDGGEEQVPDEAQSDVIKDVPKKETNKTSKKKEANNSAETVQDEKKPKNGDSKAAKK